MIDTEKLMQLADKYAFFMPGSKEGEDARKELSSAIAAFEFAVLAKLEVMDLPEPEKMPLLMIGVKHSYENVSERSFTEADFLSSAIEIFKLGQRQAYAQGAASQLSAEPVAWKYDQNGDWWVTDNWQEVEGDATGKVIALFTRKEPS
jgi:hypothetical protein